MKASLYAELKLKIIFITLVVSIAPLIFLGATIYYQFSGLCAERAKDEINQLARSQANALDVFLRERANILTTLVDTVAYEDVIQQNKLAYIFEQINRRADGLGLVDLGGDRRPGRSSRLCRPLFIGGVELLPATLVRRSHGQRQIYQRCLYGFRQLPHFIIAVRGRHQGSSWILRATIDSDVFDSLVRSVQTGQSGDAYIINKQGMYQTQPRFQGKILTPSELEPTHFGEGTTVTEKTTADAAEVFFAGTWLKNNEWLLVVSKETCDEKGRLVEIRNRNILTVALGCVAIIVATVLTTHIMVRHLERSDEKMNRLNDQLIQSDKLAALGKMAAGIAHEVNNPLAVIGEKAGWMHDLLQDENFKQSENYQEYLISVEKIEHHVERARKITHNMLGFARRMEPHSENVNINATVAQTVGMLENYSRSNNIDIQTDLATDLPIIASDPAQLQQVFLNLLTNALDAIGKDGRVDVKTGRSAAMLYVSISDDGPGIPKERQKNVFDPFYTTKLAGTGTGLGLSISYGIIEKMGGTIRLQSQVDVGSVFTVEIPIVAPKRQ